MRAVIASVSTPHGIYRVGNNTPWPAINRDKVVVRALTKGQVIVVGPTTYSMLPKNLSHEICIVVNHPESSPIEGSFDYLLCERVEEAIALSTKRFPDKKIYFLGGEKVMTDALPFCTDAYITEINCDCRNQAPIFGPLTFFPEALSLKEDRGWMIGGLLNFEEKLGDLGVTVNLRHTHYEKVDRNYLGKD